MGKEQGGLAGIIFDDELLVKGGFNFISLREMFDVADGAFGFEPRGEGSPVIEGGFDCGDFKSLGAEGDGLVGFNAVRWAVNDMIINFDVAMDDKLASHGTGRSELETVNGVVETALEELDKDFTGVGFLFTGLVEIAAELFLVEAVGVLGFLFLA
jgi:hypothetical protein